MCGRTARISSWLRTHKPGLSDFSLTADDVTLFICSQWPIPQSVFLAYRAFMACYVLAWLIMSIVNAGKTTGLGGFFVFLTNWTYIVLGVYFIVAFVSTAYASYRHKIRIKSLPSPIPAVKPDTSTGTSQPSDSNANSFAPLSSATTPPPGSTVTTIPPSQLPVYFKIMWLLLNVCLTAHPIITIIYWAFIYNPEFVYANQGGGYGVALTVHRHAFNTIFTYFDLAVSATPVKFWHFVYPWAYALLYISFSLVYFWAGGVNPYVDSPAIYPYLLDWTTPGRTIPILLGVMVILVVFHSGAYGCYRLRKHVADRLLPHVNGVRKNSEVLRNEIDMEDGSNIA